MYDTILVPTDGSPSTARVLTHAIELADRFDAGVGRVGEAMGTPAAAALERVAARGEDAGIRTETATRQGTPHEEIINYVTERVVRAVASDGEYNVHIDAATGDAVVAALPE